MGVTKVLRIAAVVAVTLIATFGYFADHSPKPDTGSTASAASGPIRSARLRDLPPTPRTRFVPQPIRAFRRSAGRGSPLAPVPAPYRPFADGFGLLRRAGMALSQLVVPSLAAIPATLGNFDGIGNGVSGFTVNSAPPDTNGDVGPNHYVQIVNSDFAVFDKTTHAATFGPVAINTLWSGFGGDCETNNDGDPTVLYDPIADRWIISQFSVTGADGVAKPFLQCVAVSTSPDPTGSYNRYRFPYAGFPDYPKMGVWPDAYYTTFNMFNVAGTAFLGGKICAYDRAKMLAGAPATQQCFDVGASFGGLLPADLDGARQPPAGAPNWIVGLGASNNDLAYWKFHVDWPTPAHSTLTGPTTLVIAPYAQACPLGTCIPQRGTSQQLDSLADRLMYRLAYRNFGDHESLVVNHSVTAGSGAVGVRWYELRAAAGALSIFQQGTYAPDLNFRWMGSIAMDQSGNIGLGFSVSGTSRSPGIHYTGRLAGDSAGVMTQGEGTIIDGGGSQGAGLSRWGDYSMMAVDPSDDCTFWYTNEYLQTSGTFNWSTRIASFKFPGCGPSTIGTIALSPATGSSLTGLTHSVTAHAQNGATPPSPVAGATVTFTVLTGPNAGKTGSATTDSSGNASFTYRDLGPGTDTIQAKIGTTLTSNTVSMTWTITTVTPVITVSNGVYDGTTAASLLTCALSGAVASPPGDPVSCSGVATFSDKNVGNGKTVTATGITLTGVGAANYVLSTTTATTTANITPRPLGITVTPQTKVYDGSTPATYTQTDNRIAGDVLTVAFTAADFVNKNVGNGKTVVMSGLTVTGTDSGNYTPSMTVGTANITPRPLTVIVTGVNKVYDGLTTATVTLSDNRVVGDLLSASYANAGFADKTVGGGKPVSVSGIAIAGADAGNYSFNTTASTTADITLRPLTVSAIGANKVYDGSTTATVTLSDNRVAGDVLTTSSSSASFADKTAGTGKAVSLSGIAISGADATNYSLTATTASTTADITPRPLTVSTTGVNKVYDGSTTATVTLSDNRVAADVLSTSYASASFADKTVGTAKAVTVSGIAIAGTDAGNYSLTATAASTTANITPKPATVTAGGGTKGHGTPDPAISASATGFLPADGVTVSATRAVGESVGSYVTSAIASGAALANYGVTYVTGTFTITKASLTVVANDKTRSHTAPNPVFDGRVTGVAAGDGITVTYSTTATNVPGTYPITPALVDPNGALGNYTVTLTPGRLTLTNGAPVAVNDAYTTQWNTVFTVPAKGVLLNDTDVDADPLTAITLTNPTHGAVTLHANGSFTYTPTANYSGADSFTYKANDGYLDSNVATVKLTITSPCHADDDRDHHDDRNRVEWENCKPGTPNSHSDSYRTLKNKTLTVAPNGVLKNDGRFAATAELYTVPLHGAVTLGGNGGFIYIPALNFVGTDVFYYVPRSAAGVAGAVTSVTIRVSSHFDGDGDDRGGDRDR